MINIQASRDESYIRSSCEDDLENIDDDIVSKAMEMLTIETATEAAEEKSVQPKEKETQKISRSQRRRMAKCEKARLEKEENDSRRKELSKSSLREKELKQMTGVLGKDGLRLYEIASDGHCLFRAVQHQLILTKSAYTPSSSSEGHLELRRLASTYMKNHSEDFLPFFVAESGDKSAADSFARHCDRVANTSDWGGQLEIRALSRALRTPIFVYSAKSPVLKMGETFKDSPLRLAYHKHFFALGEHYNATVPA